MKSDTVTAAVAAPSLYPSSADAFGDKKGKLSLSRIISRADDKPKK